MTKFKKIVSGTLAGCLMASALMMSAGAANMQTGALHRLLLPHRMYAAQ